MSTLLPVLLTGALFALFAALRPRCRGCTGAEADADPGRGCGACHLSSHPSGGDLIEDDRLRADRARPEPGESTDAAH